MSEWGRRRFRTQQHRHARGIPGIGTKAGLLDTDTIWVSDSSSAKKDNTSTKSPQDESDFVFENDEREEERDESILGDSIVTLKTSVLSVRRRNIKFCIEITGCMTSKLVIIYCYYHSLKNLFSFFLVHVLLQLGRRRHINSCGLHRQIICFFKFCWYTILYIQLSSIGRKWRYSVLVGAEHFRGSFCSVLELCSPARLNMSTSIYSRRGQQLAAVQM